MAQSETIPRTGTANASGARPAGNAWRRKVIETTLGGIGVRINGPDPWDIQVHDERFFQRALEGAGLGLGESYMDGWWDCAALDEFVAKALCSGVERMVFGNWRLSGMALT
jgi:cyclopropane-fatty-acyl-phospholipid synthase